MAETVVLTARPRSDRGKQAARKLRRQGLLPAVVYGHGEETVALVLDLDAVHNAIRHGARVVDLDADGQTQRAQIREVQWDHLGKDLLHIDFKRIDKDELITVTVAIELRGTAPGVTAGGVLDQPLHTLELECAASAIPDSVRVNVGELQIGGAIHVRDLHLPAGVRPLNDADALVVHVKAPLAEAEAEPGAAPAESAEPEVIGRQKAEEEEAGE